MPKIKYRRVRVKRVKPPKPIPPPKPKRPRRGDLKNIYKGLLAIDIGQRVNTLAKAMAWYDSCLVYILFKQEGKWTRAQLAHKNEAEKMRAFGIAKQQLRPKESAFTESIHSYEKLVLKYKPPKLDTVLKKLKQKSELLEQRQDRMKDKHGKFLRFLQQSLNPISHYGPVKLKVAKLEGDSQIDAEGNVTFDRNKLLSLRRLARKRGVLAAILDIMPVMSEAVGRLKEVDNSGHQTSRFLIDSGKRFWGVLTMLNNFQKYCRQPEGPRTIIRRMKKETK